MPGRRLLAIVVIATALAGCRVDAELRVALAEDGTGTLALGVTLDEDAVRRIAPAGTPLEEAVRLDDLEAAGWQVGPWALDEDGGATVRVARPFVGEEDLRRRLGELAGAGTHVTAEIRRERGVLRDRDELSLGIDLRGLATGLAEDRELAESLAAAGVDPAALGAQLDAGLRDAFRLRVTAEVPGDRSGSVVVEPGGEATVTAARATFDAGRLVVLAIAAMLGVLALALVVAASASARRERRRAAGNLDDVPRM